MGLIGIWCMHFIGNRSIALAAGQTRLQLVYDPRYTGLSCVLPVMGLTVAFQIAELRINHFVLRRLLDVACGLMAGLSIVSMHYVGNLGVSNYKLIYPKRYIVGACIFAFGDSTIALALFFYFKERWISVCWKRCLCALLLAVGVCGMHFTASVGCQYQLKRIPSEIAPDVRNTPVIVAATMVSPLLIYECGVTS
jgi:NO-binding membrane sensor protein with MHYT domain